MVIESIVICMDNSEYMRNEDYPPSRMMSQCEAVDLIVQTKLKSHPENHVAIMAFSKNEVLTNLTTNENKLLTELYKVQVGGEMRLLQGLHVAQLVLKHRPFKNHKCRIIAFVGSPVALKENDAVNLGKKFKKENVSVDIIKFGIEKEGAKELEMLVSTMNGSTGGNNFLEVPQNTALCDYLVTTSLLSGAARGSVHFNDDDDDDLRRALEMSLREAEAREMQAPTVTSTAQPTGMQDGNDLSEEEQMALAIQMSLQERDVARDGERTANEGNDGRRHENSGPPAKRKMSGSPNNGKGPTSKGEEHKNTKRDQNKDPPPPAPKK